MGKSRKKKKKLYNMTQVVCLFDDVAVLVFALLAKFDHTELVRKHCLGAPLEHNITSHMRALI